MKIFVRVLLFLLALCLLCGLLAILATFTAIPWVSGFVQQMTQRYTWLPLAFSILLLFFMAVTVLALVLIVTVPTKRRLFIVGHSAGMIEISRQSIESSAKASLDTIHEVKRFHVQSKGDMRPGKLKLDVQAEPRGDDVNLAEMGRAVQQRLSQDLAGTLAIEPKHIKVRVQPVNSPLEAGHGHSKVPRVV